MNTETRAFESWAPKPLDALVAGVIEDVEPTHLIRSDGVALLYPGLTHSISGPPSSGKSWLALWWASEVISMGGRVLYIDYESRPAKMAGRLQAFQAKPRDVRDGFVYVNPDEGSWGGGALAPYLEDQWDFIVVDGVNEALILDGKDPSDNASVTTWSRQIPRALADDTGAAVLLIDHVPKSGTESRYGFGAQAKLASITGAAFMLVPRPSSPFGRGLVGKADLRLSKDREGYLTTVSEYRESSDLRDIGTFALDSTGDYARGALYAPLSDAQDRDGLAAYVGALAAVSEALSADTRPYSRKRLHTLTGISFDVLDAVLDELTKTGRARVVPVGNRIEFTSAER